MRSFASTDREEPLYPDMNVPTYWVRPTAIPPATPGDHRFVWDLHEAAPHSVDHSFPISAIVHATPHDPEGIIVVPRVAFESFAAVRGAKENAATEQFRRLNASLGRLYGAVESADARPTIAQQRAAAQLIGRLSKAGASPLESPKADEP